MRTQRRAEIRLDLSVKTSLATLEILLKELEVIIQKNSDDISAHSIFLKELNKTTLTIIIEYFTWPFSIEEFDTLKQTINLRIKKLLEENGVEFGV